VAEIQSLVRRIWADVPARHGGLDARRGRDGEDRQRPDARARHAVLEPRAAAHGGAAALAQHLRPLFLPYGDLWRNGRKLMHHLTMASAATSYQPIQEEEEEEEGSVRVLRDLVRDPVEYERWFERYAAGLILRLAFGQTIYTGTEDSVRRILAVVHTVERVASPGAYLVDILPSLMYLPSLLLFIHIAY
jgi:hypothetical protein